jgi:AhpD family alkylhydroperoxidase
MKPGDSRRGLSTRDGRLPALLRHGARALAATVAGDDDAAHRHYAAALAVGTAPVALLEIARMAHLLGGFPRAILGLRALERALAGAGTPAPRDPEPSAPRGAALRNRGERLFRSIYGSASELVLARLEHPARGYSCWVLDDAYGRVLARPGLAPVERELLNVAALAALACPAQLESHVRGARRLGATAERVAAMVELGQSTGRRKSGARQTRRRRRQ